MQKCSIEGCEKPIINGYHDLCWGHYQRRRRHGDPLAGRVNKGSLDNFVKNIAVVYEEDDCLIWPFGRTKKGYGCATKIEAHRWVCFLSHGEPPAGKTDAAHSCGNRLCVNPKHLRWASRKENVADTLAHGTDNRGEKSPTSKLTADQVRQIRSLYGTMTVRELAAKFGVSGPTICNIQFRQTWAWLD